MKIKTGQTGKTPSSQTTLPPGHQVSAPADPDCSQVGPGPSPWLRRPQGWWGCSGWEASAWAVSGASERWPGGWHSSEELLWGLPQDPGRLGGVGHKLVPGARGVRESRYWQQGHVPGMAGIVRGGGDHPGPTPTSRLSKPTLLRVCSHFYKIW